MARPGLAGQPYYFWGTFLRLAQYPDIFSPLFLVPLTGKRKDDHVILDSSQLVHTSHNVMLPVNSGVKAYREWQPVGRQQSS